jgi:hypothetical protein
VPQSRIIGKFTLYRVVVAGKPVLRGTAGSPARALELFSGLPTIEGALVTRYWASRPSRTTVAVPQIEEMRCYRPAKLRPLGLWLWRVSALVYFFRVQGRSRVWPSTV